MMLALLFAAMVMIKAMTWTRWRRVALAAMLLCAGPGLAVPAMATPAASNSSAIEPLIEAAKSEGRSVVVIGPPPPTAAQVEPLPSGGAMLASLAGKVTKQIRMLGSAVSTPGWPAAASDRVKPFLNGLLTVVGLGAGLVVVRRADFQYRERLGERRPHGTPPGARPARIFRAAIGVLIAAVAAMVLPFLVYGPGSKTVELVGAITEMFLRCAVTFLIAAPLLERAQEQFVATGRWFDAARVVRDLRATLIAIFLFASAALTLTFMYPDPALATLARIGFATLVCALVILLAYWHRDDLTLLAGAAGRLRAIGASAWALLAGYVVLAWVIACVRLLLRIPDAIDIVLAPAAALLGGLAVYHLALWLFAIFLKRDVAPAPLAAGSPTAHDVLWPARLAKGLGVAAALVVAFERFGFPMTRPDGALAAVPATAMVLLLAYAVWAYASEAIDRRIALEAVPEEQDSEAEGGSGRSRLATLLPLFRNALQIMVIFIAGLMLLRQAGINTTPIFASAGIVGLALGFGAQSLVKDIISGLFYLLDDAFRVGEYIEIGGIKGTVERISIRSMQLRHQNGPLNTIAFGTIEHMTNYSRDWVIMKLPIVVTLDTDVERVRKLVKKIGQELLDDPQFGHKFMEPLKSQGVLSIDNFGITIRVKFKTRPGEQFTIRRIVYAKLHEMFDHEGIHFASRDVKVSISSPAGGANIDHAAVAAAVGTLDG